MSVAIAASAALAAEMQRQEEEEMTPYSPKDLDEGWEFKILRSNFRRFAIRKNCGPFSKKRNGAVGRSSRSSTTSASASNAPAGAKVAQGDFGDGYDPYRTTVGMAKGAGRNDAR